MGEVWLKTKDVAEELNVSPGTILKWVKKYDIPHSVNASGHYYFEKEQVKQFHDIQEKAMDRLEQKGAVPTEFMLERLAEVEEKTEILEKMIGNKADEIIGFQLIEQRREVRALQKQLEKMEEKLNQLDERTKKKIDDKGDKERGNKKEKGLLAGIFSV